jgi:hypothetical protein
MTMKKILTAFFLLGLTGCGITTHTAIHRGSQRTAIEIDQEMWGFHLLYPALHGLSIEFSSSLIDNRGIIPASSILVADTGFPPLTLSTNAPGPYQGFIDYDDGADWVEIRLFKCETDLYGHNYYPQHPLNGIHKVTSLKIEQEQNHAPEGTARKLAAPQR